MSVSIPFKLAVQQRVLPIYRVPFFDLLAESCQGGMSLFYGDPRPDESLGTQGEPQVAQRGYARNIYLGSGRLYACVQRGLVTWLESWQPDVLVVEANPRYLSTPRAASWMRARGKPVIGWGLGAPPSANFWRELLREHFLDQFAAMITYSQIGADQYKRAGFPEEKIFIAPNAVTRRPSQVAPLRSESFAGQPVVLFVGRLQKRKRVDLLIQACAAQPEGLRPRLIVVGDGPEKGTLQKLAESVYPQTEFTGELRGEALAPYWAKADLFVLPGTGGLAVQEAMSAGLPVMAAEADGTQADLVRKENGWRLLPGDVDDLTSRLTSALQNPARLRRMGNESFRIVSEEINLDRMIETFARAVQLVTST